MSDAFYQALSMKCDSLPRASKVKAARWEFNKTVEHFSIPTFDGSYRHVEMAIREEITRLVSDSVSSKKKSNARMEMNGYYKFSTQ